MSGFHLPKKRSLLDNAFLAFEAVMHVYLTIYLISIDAAILAIGFTVFELTMFIRLLRKGVKPKDAYCDDICPWKNGVNQKVERCPFDCSACHECPYCYDDDRDCECEG